MKFLFALLLVGCSVTPEDSKQAQFTLEKWARSLVDCPTAEVVPTSWGGDRWIGVRTFYIRGCGMKYCCNHEPGNSMLTNAQACFPCKKDQWYGNGS